MKSGKLIIFNRTAPVAGDGDIHIVPYGELYNAAAGINQVFDNVSMRAIRANWEIDKARLGNRWPGLYGGQEHWIYKDDKSSAAFAWFKKFKVRGDGIWGSADDLTDLGRDAVQNRRFKFTSCVVPADGTEPLGGNRHRILKVETIGFTNAANGKELLTPIMNRTELLRHGTTGQDAASGDPEIVPIQDVSLRVAFIERERACSFADAWNLMKAESPRLYSDLLASDTGKAVADAVEADLNDPDNTTLIARAAQFINNRAAAQLHMKAQMNQQGREVLINRIRSEQKCDHTTAWNIAREEDPALFGISKAVAITNRRARADSMTVIANRIQRELRCNFATAWSMARSRHPEAFA